MKGSDSLAREADSFDGGCGGEMSIGADEIGEEIAARISSSRSIRQSVGTPMGPKEREDTGDPIATSEPEVAGNGSFWSVQSHHA